MIHMPGVSLRMLVLPIVALTSANIALAADLHGSGKSVVDGDEFILCEGNACADIRLCGIDTPSKGKPRYEETISALTKLVVGNNVECRPVGEGSVCDGRTRATSRGRTVAQCFVKGATVDVAEALVSAGLGCDNVKRSGGHYSKGHPDSKCKEQ
jgi:endonuclease YncB( thermonuclease family)